MTFSHRTANYKWSSNLPFSLSHSHGALSVSIQGTHKLPPDSGKVCAGVSSPLEKNQHSPGCSCIALEWSCAHVWVYSTCFPAWKQAGFNLQLWKSGSREPSLFLVPFKPTWKLKLLSDMQCRESIAFRCCQCFKVRQSTVAKSIISKASCAKNVT